MMLKHYSRDYWDMVVRKFSCGDHEVLWRAYIKDIYQGLMDRWAENSNARLSLKTDLYDEAISTYNLIPLLGQRCEYVIGIDVSFEVAIAAKRRMKTERNIWNNAVVSDIRNLAFRSNSFDQIISNSTIDHFLHKNDIIISLKEVYRVLKPEGVLIITLDNPINPLIFLRNLLPYYLLKSLRIIPFYMGVTVSKSKLIPMLESNGFRVYDSTAIVHSPRILAIWIGYLLYKIGSERTKGYFRKILKVFERLERFPLRYLTGYFIAVKAVKR